MKKVIKIVLLVLLAFAVKTLFHTFFPKNEVPKGALSIRELSPQYSPLVVSKEIFGNSIRFHLREGLQIDIPDSWYIPNTEMRGKITTKINNVDPNISVSPKTSINIVGIEKSKQLELDILYPSYPFTADNLHQLSMNPDLMNSLCNDLEKGLDGILAKMQQHIVKHIVCKVTTIGNLNALGYTLGVQNIDAHINTISAYIIPVNGKQIILLFTQPQNASDVTSVVEGIKKSVAIAN